MAPVTAGRRSAEAIATSQGERLRRAPTARIRSRRVNPALTTYTKGLWVVSLLDKEREARSE